MIKFTVPTLTTTCDAQLNGLGEKGIAKKVFDPFFADTFEVYIEDQLVGRVVTWDVCLQDGCRSMTADIYNQLPDETVITVSDVAFDIFGDHKRMILCICFDELEEKAKKLNGRKILVKVCDETSVGDTVRFKMTYSNGKPYRFFEKDSRFSHHSGHIIDIHDPNDVLCNGLTALTNEELAIAPKSLQVILIEEIETDYNGKFFVAEILLDKLWTVCVADEVYSFEGATMNFIRDGADYRIVVDDKVIEDSCIVAVEENTMPGTLVLDDEMFSSLPKKLVATVVDDCMIEGYADGFFIVRLENI